MIALRPFSKNDWLGLAGAECFTDGAAPLVGECLVDGVEATVVLDANGLAVMWAAAVGDDVVDHTVYWTTTAAAQALALLPAATSRTVLEAMGGELL